MRGMIIIGYPGIGATTLAKKQKDIIKLDNIIFKVNSPTNWAELYCKVALSLANSGKTVFVSCHKDVQDELTKDVYQNIRKYVIMPDFSLYKRWKKKLAEIRNHYRESERLDLDWVSIERLIKNGFTVIRIYDDIVYDLANMVYHLQKLQAAS